MPRVRRDSGFTLIELLVVIAIIGVILATSLPALTSYGQQMRLKATTRQLVGLLGLARQKAISSRHERTILVDVEGRQILIEESLDEDAPQRIELPKSIEVSVDSAGTDPDVAMWRIVFQPSGALSGRSAAIHLTSQKRTQIVAITAATGSISVSAATVPDEPAPDDGA